MSILCRRAFAPVCFGLLWLGALTARAASPKPTPTAAASSAPKPAPAESSSSIPQVKKPTDRPSPSSVSLDDLIHGASLEKISFKEAVTMALRNNLDARISEIGIQVEQAKIRFEVGAFDPNFSIQLNRESLRVPENSSSASITQQVLQQQTLTAINAQTGAIDAQTNSIIDQTNAFRAIYGLPPISTGIGALRLSNAQTDPGILNVIVADQQNDRFSTSLVQRTPWGMRVGIFAEANRLRSTNSIITGDVDPGYQTSTQIQIVQPLLRDFGPAANLAQLRIARISKQLAILAWKQRVMGSLQEVATTYYDLVAGVSDVGVRQEAIIDDQRLVRYNQKRLEAGVTQPFDVQQSLAQVSLDEEQLLASKNFLLERQFQLKRLILPQFDSNDLRIFVPRNTKNLPLPNPDRSVHLQQAFARRPDFLQTLAQAEAQEIRLRFAYNQLLPQLDIAGTYGLNGLSDGFDNSFDQGFKGRTPSWSIGISLKIPLGNIQARAQVDQVKALKQQAILNIKQSELTIGIDVDTQLSRIETNRKRLDTARKTVALNEEAVRIATRRLQEGQLSSFDIIEQLRLLYGAKTRELGAEAELNKSITQLWLATGTIFEELGLKIPDPK